MNRTIGAKNQAEALLPTDWGTFLITAHAADRSDYTPHLVLRHPEMDVTDSVYVRVHSECITGDIFHSKKCDCGLQLDKAMEIIAQQKGVLIYMRQEGRGIGIINKLKAYKHQENGLDTIEANEALGLEVDYREYDEAVTILKDLGISKIHILTNNPDKIKNLNTHGIEVTSRVPLIIPANESSEGYLNTKEKSMGHLLSTQDQN